MSTISKAVDTPQAVSLATLPAGELILVETRNSHYRVVLTDPQARPRPHRGRPRIPGAGRCPRRGRHLRRRISQPGLDQCRLGVGDPDRRSLPSHLRRPKHPSDSSATPAPVGATFLGRDRDSFQRTEIRLHRGRHRAGHTPFLWGALDPGNLSSLIHRAVRAAHGALRGQHDRTGAKARQGAG